MRPKKHETTTTDDLFRSRLDQIINMKNELAQLAGQIDWDFIDGEIAPLYSEKGRPGIETIGIYIEGFRDGDGLHFVRAVRRAVAAGQDVVIYKAGATPAGVLLALDREEQGRESTRSAVYVSCAFSPASMSLNGPAGPAADNASCQARVSPPFRQFPLLMSRTR